MERKKVLELDKICRVCISERKDMRPLFGEKIAEMLMECASVNIENTEGWPDKICLQCVHAVSRCHAFKKQVERSDKELREYIKSLTVRLVIEDTPEITIEKPPPPPTPVKKPQRVQLTPHGQLQLQQHQQHQQQQQQLQHQHQQQQQQVLLQQQQQQQQHQQQQQQQVQVQLQVQQQQQQQQQPQKRKIAAVTRKTSRQSKKLQHQPAQLQPQQLIQIQQQPAHHQSLNESMTLHSVVTSPRQQTQHLQAAQTQQQQQQQQQTLQQQPPQQILSTTALPQQIVLPNGQIITTAQIVTHAGTPQIAQIISTGNGSPPTAAVTTTAPQAQFTPQLIQTTSGQTLQLIQQANGQQTLQLVQLVPQRTIATTSSGGSVVVTTTDDGTTLVDEDTLITPDSVEHHLIDADDAEIDEDDEQEQICETIVVEDDTLPHQQLLAAQHHTIVDDDNLSQSETQELEYLEDVTVTTTNVGQQHVHHHHHHQHQHQQQHYQHLSDCDGDVSQQQHLQLHDEDDIIEEIHMEEEMLEDDGSGGVMHVMDADDAEFISGDEEVHQQHLVGDCVQHDSSDPLQYTVMEATDDDDGLVESDVKEVLQAACGTDLHTVVDFNQAVSSGGGSGAVTVASASAGGMSGASVGSQTNTAKRTRKSNSKAVANSRQLVATASSIVSAGTNDDAAIDPKFIAEFISQQTRSLGTGRYVCNLCRHEFRQFKGLQNHMHQHSNWIRANCKKQPQCEICSKSFKGPGMLRMHMKTHQSASRVPTCNVCGKYFKSKAILYRHRQTHQQRAYSCGVENCRKTFSMPVTLRAHSERKHANAAQPKFKCGECAVHFDDVNVLHTHIQMTGHGSAAGSTDGETGAVIVVTQA